jgi:putative effector of murein hydrolase LrgA (UPF0299 family)
MIPAFTVLLSCQLAGELLSRLFRWPFPGPVLGMLLLLAVLLARPRSESVVREPATALLRHLSLLFVPAGVGLIRSAAVLRTQWLAIACAIVLSTAATMAVSALVFARVARALRNDR